MQKRPGTASTGWVFAFSTYPPKDAIKTPWYIGCDEHHRHILGASEFGYDDWQTCVLPSGEFAVSCQLPKVEDDANVTDYPQCFRRELSV
jgi:hypothetical protein